MCYRPCRSTYPNDVVCCSGLHFTLNQFECEPGSWGIGVPSPSWQFVPRVHWRTKVLTAIEVVRDVEAASFHSAGLRRLRLYASDLTSSPYPRITRKHEYSPCQRDAEWLARLALDMRVTIRP